MTLKKTLCAALVAGVLWGISAAGAQDQALEPVLVTATRIETPAADVASSASVVTAEEMEAAGVFSVTDAIRPVPGLIIVKSGAPGGDASVFMRGANSYHTLVLVDGIETADPMSTTRATDLAHFDVSAVDRIEVVRGPQSVLYGSDAMGGVINIITKKGEGTPRHTLEAMGGSYGTWRAAAESSGAHDGFDYAAGVSCVSTEGFSAADEAMPGNSEDDGYRADRFSTRLGYENADRAGVSLILHRIFSRADLDNFGGPYGDDPNFRADKEQWFTRVEGRGALLDGAMVPCLGVSYTDIARDDKNSPDAAHPFDSSKSSFDSSLVKYDMQDTWTASDTTTLVGGVEYEEERGSSAYVSESMFGPYSFAFDEKTARTAGVYVEDQFVYGDRFVGTVGGRIDDHSRFGAEPTWRAAPAYLWNDGRTKLKGSVGTGFKAPSLYQLFSQYGDPDLDPERSLGIDGGVEHELVQGVLSAEAVYFRNAFDDLIDYDTGANKYVNISEAVADGVETGIRYAPRKELALDAFYTYTETEDTTTGDALLRRPKHAITGRARWQATDRLALSLNAVYYGKSEDMNYTLWPAERVTLGDFTVVGCAGDFAVSKTYTVFARVDNLLDEDYEQIYGYGTAGLSGYVGVRATF